MILNFSHTYTHTHRHVTGFFLVLFKYLASFHLEFKSRLGKNLEDGIA